MQQTGGVVESSRSENLSYKIFWDFLGKQTLWNTHNLPLMAVYVSNTLKFNFSSSMCCKNDALIQ